jgi:hypothetical protein
MLRPAVFWFVGFLLAFFVLSQLAARSLALTAVWTVLLLPGIVVQTVISGNPHSVGTLATVAAFVLDYALVLAIVAALRKKRVP